MTDATDDLELAEYFGTSSPVRDIDGTWYIYRYKGVKYQFRTLEKASEWAKSRGFSLSITPAKPSKEDINE